MHMSSGSGVPDLAISGPWPRCVSPRMGHGMIAGGPSIRSGPVRDLLVQRRRNTQAAKTLFRKLLKGVTDVP